MLSLRGWFAGLYQLPAALLLVIGLFNLAYGSTSFTLAMATRGNRVPGLKVIAFANMVWAGCCLVLAAVWWRVASPFGLLQLIGEAIFVGTLGVLEWRAKNLN